MLNTGESKASLFEIFHENTKYTRTNYPLHAARIAAHLRSREAIQAMSRNVKSYRFAGKRVLPRAQALQLPFCETLQRRVSTRLFSGEALSLETLATVLVPAAACNRRMAVKSFTPIELHFRAYPSGGGEYPVEIYPVLMRVEGEPLCVTHFDPRDGALSVLPRGAAIGGLPRALMNADDVLQTAAVLIVLTAIFERSTVKYADRGYRLVLLEAGHVAQNLCLTAAAAGLGSLAWGGYFDDELNRLIGVDGLHEAVVHCVVIGGVQS